MRPIFVSALFASLTTIAAAEPAFRTDPHSLALNCTPTFATSQDYKDPIKNIRVKLTPKGASIVHEAKSGTEYNRTEQYLQNSAQWKGDNFTWRGVRSTNPRIAMTGVIELGPNGYTYRESQFDAALGGRKTYDMVSLCTADLRPAPSQPPRAPNEGRSVLPPFAAEKQRMVEITNERLVACAEPKLSELAASGEMAATLTDATISFCREALDDSIAARVLLTGSPSERELIRTAVRQEIVSMAVQTLADMKRDRH
jgi:hypothetical protein